MCRVLHGTSSGATGAAHTAWRSDGASVLLLFARSVEIVGVGRDDGCRRMEFVCLCCDCKEEGMQGSKQRYHGTSILSLSLSLAFSLSPKLAAAAQNTASGNFSPQRSDHLHSRHTKGTSDDDNNHNNDLHSTVVHAP